MATARRAGIGIAALVAGLVWLLHAGASADEGLSIGSAWIAETPPGASNAAGYAVIVNPGEAATRIVAARSDCCERIEFHEISNENGVARMRPRPALEIAPGGTLALDPSGMHLMLIRPGTLRAGDRVTIHFEIENGEEHAVHFEVRGRESDAPAPHGPHDHHGHH